MNKIPQDAIEIYSESEVDSDEYDDYDSYYFNNNISTTEQAICDPLLALVIVEEHT